MSVEGRSTIPLRGSEGKIQAPSQGHSLGSPAPFKKPTWEAQLVRRLALDLGSGHGLRVLGSSPMLGSALSGELA